MANKALKFSCLQSFRIKNRQAIRGMSLILHTENSLQMDQLVDLIMRDEDQDQVAHISLELPIPQSYPELMEAESSLIEKSSKEDSEYVGHPRPTPKGKKVQKVKKTGNLTTSPQTASKGRKRPQKKLSEVQKLIGKSANQDYFHLEDESSKGSLTSLDEVLGKSCSLPSQLKEALINEKKNIENTLTTTHCASSGDNPRSLPSIEYQALVFKKFHYTAHFWVVDYAQPQKENVVLSRTRNKDRTEPFGVWASQTFQRDDMEVYFNNALSRLKSPQIFNVIMELNSLYELKTKDTLGNPIICQDKKATSFSDSCPEWLDQELFEWKMKKRMQLEKRRYISVEEYGEMVKQQQVEVKV